MSNENLYNSPKVANLIKNYAKLKKIALKDMLTELNMGSNTFSHMLHGKSIAFDSLARIADYLDCSVDYLLGRTDDPELHKLVKTPAEQIFYIRTAASSGSVDADESYKFRKEPYTAAELEGIKKLKDVDDLE